MGVGNRTHWKECAGEGAMKQGERGQGVLWDKRGHMGRPGWAGVERKGQKEGVVI